MAFKEVSRVEIKEIIRQWQDGNSVRQLSKRLGMSRTTISKYIQGAEHCGLTRDGPAPTEEQLTRLAILNIAGPRHAERQSQDMLEPWAQTIREWIEKDRLILTRIHELLGWKGCTVSYSSLRRFVIRKGWSRRKQTTVRMAKTNPGEVAEMDFGRLGMIWDETSGRRRMASMMILTMKYSRHCFAWPMFTQKLDDVIEGFEKAWAFFGGIPKYVVIDNFPAAVAGTDPLNPRLTRGFMEYTQHRGFIPDPARSYHPQDKPQVERNVPYVRERFFKGGQFHSLSDMRSQARDWCLKVAGQRVHGTTRRLPLMVFEDEEKGTLIPWDGRPYDVPIWQEAKVHQDHHIQCGCAFYSIPYSACPPGKKVEVKMTSKLVKVHYRGAVIKIHPRQGKGERSTDYDDYPPEKTPYSMRSIEHLHRQCDELGQSIGVFTHRLLNIPVPWSRIRQVQKLLRMADKYTPARLESACEKALAVDLIDVRRVEHILKEALEKESLPDDNSTVPLPSRFARSGEVFSQQGVRL